MARPRVYDERRVTTAIRIPASLHDRLRDAASQRDVSVNYLVIKALDDFLERLVPADEVVRVAR
ncbi:MAG: toxin-antitoxin system HicB family antitoxin [Actinomycetota bacterium]|nr:toxin-antitoxin system HicB family antitoxin [Actinomycetota bacterium]